MNHLGNIVKLNGAEVDRSMWLSAAARARTYRSQEAAARLSEVFEEYTR